MKTVTIEQVVNGYIVSHKVSELDYGIKGDIHVFETFDSMSNWLQGHFAAGIPAPKITHLGTDET